jgi:hypothetical protein
MKPQSMTPHALACRADHVTELDAMMHIIADGVNEDQRMVTAFFEYEDCDIDGDTPDGFTVAGYCLHLIGVTIGDDEALTREEARELFGDAWIERIEGDPWDAAYDRP